MAKIAGVDVLLKVKKGGSYVAIGGQKACSLSRSASTIDVTDKTSGGWSESIVGIKSWSLDCDGFVTLGDEGFKLLVQAFDNRTPLDVEIKVGNDTGYTYTGLVVITDFPEDYPQDDAVSFSLSLAGASPLVRKENTALVSAKA